MHGKGRCEEKLPLPADVGAAVADYLRHGRPRTTSRAVFVRLHVPLRELTPIGVSALVCRACARAGVGRVSAHPLRHTAATEMLQVSPASDTNTGFVRSPGNGPIGTLIKLRALCRRSTCRGPRRSGERWQCALAHHASKVHTAERAARLPS